MEVELKITKIDGRPVYYAGNVGQTRIFSTKKENTGHDYYMLYFLNINNEVEAVLEIDGNGNEVSHNLNQV